MSWFSVCTRFCSLISHLLGVLFDSFPSLGLRFSVDTFFFVSGFLVVYAMLRRFKHDYNGVKVQHKAYGTLKL